MKRKRERKEGRNGEDQNRGGARQAGRLVHSLPGGAPRWPMLARRVQEQNDASELSLEERRNEESRSLGETWWPRPTRRPPEDEARESRAYSSRQGCRHV